MGSATSNGLVGTPPIRLVVLGVSPHHRCSRNGWAKSPEKAIGLPTRRPTCLKVSRVESPLLAVLNLRHYRFSGRMSVCFALPQSSHRTDAATVDRSNAELTSSAPSGAQFTERSTSRFSLGRHLAHIDILFRIRDFYAFLREALVNCSV